MDLHLMSYNIQGLSGRAKRISVRTFLERFRPRVDVLCIQEHHLRMAETKAIKRKVCRDAEIIIAPATDGRRALNNPDVISGKGGLFIAVSANHTQYISTKGILVSGAGVWCILDHPHFGKFGVMGVYAPTTTIERTALWRELTDFMDVSHLWLLLGDLNMVEQAADQLGGNPRDLGGWEQRAFATSNGK
jgi:endonuclease/exonuclease/phosphatase family metal-dependent hydrolase